MQHYSGGMIRRLEIAQSMLHRPKILLMDEPTVGLDPLARHAVGTCARLREDPRYDDPYDDSRYGRGGRALRPIAVMNHGRIEVIGAPAELKRQVGAEATLDDVFAHYTGLEISPRPDIGRRGKRDGAREHG